MLRRLNQLVLLLLIIISTHPVSATAAVDVYVDHITEIIAESESSSVSKFRIDTVIEVINSGSEDYYFYHSITCIFILIIEYHGNDDWTKHDTVPCDFGLSYDIISPGNNNLTGHGYISFNEEGMEYLPDGGYTISFSDNFISDPNQSRGDNFELKTHEYDFAMQNGKVIQSTLKFPGLIVFTTILLVTGRNIIRRKLS